MKKLLFFFSFTILLFFSSISTAKAAVKCPTTQTQYQYVFDSSLGKCCISGPQGRTCNVDPIGCTDPNETYNSSSKNCISTTNPPSQIGCSAVQTGRPVFCINRQGQSIYCSTPSECEDLKDNLGASGLPGVGQSSQDTSNSIGCNGDIKKGINTAIGCIPIGNQDDFIGWVLGWAIGIGGGIAFLLILFAGFQIMTSAGDPKKLQAGQELLTSAIGGLILLIFSVFILKFIGIDILGIPGLGSGN